MKHILITGKGSYIGTQVEAWLNQSSHLYHVDTLDMREPSWQNHDFSRYDVVFHVAGIAHVSTDPKMKDLYYQVNTDLAIETAKKAKSSHVKQFIFMSSLIVYGDSSLAQRIIDRSTLPNPTNFYGDSKLQAELGLKALDSPEFKVVILRPPMIYGPHSKGNYQKLAKLAIKTPLFPDFKNQRSVLFISHLCAFIELMIKNEEQGTFFPQNKHFQSTTDFVRAIAKSHQHPMIFTRWFNPFIKALFIIPLVRKAFGNLVYDPMLSVYDKGEYHFYDFETTIELSQKG